MSARNHLFVNSASALALIFLYAPIAWIVAYSFNESQLVTVWSRFSTKWYAALLQDEQVLRAARISFEVAFASATGATALGTMVGYALARFGRFPGRPLLAGAMIAILAIPEIIMAISMLLLFVALESAIGWPHRDLTTIILAHITFSTAFVAVVVQTRVGELDVSIEEAAADLGARPLRVFALVTLPLIAPALLSGWLLAFSLSLDDLVITSFVSGPSSTTLPMVVFSKVRLGLNPEINALGTLIILAVSLVAALSVLRTLWRRERAA